MEMGAEAGTIPLQAGQQVAEQTGQQMAEGMERGAQGMERGAREMREQSAPQGTQPTQQRTQSAQYRTQQPPQTGQWISQEPPGGDFGRRSTGAPTEMEAGPGPSRSPGSRESFEGPSQQPSQPYQSQPTSQPGQTHQGPPTQTPPTQTPPTQTPHRGQPPQSSTGRDRRQREETGEYSQRIDTDRRDRREGPQARERQPIAQRSHHRDDRSSTGPGAGGPDRDRNDIDAGERTERESQDDRGSDRG